MNSKEIAQQVVANRAEFGAASLEEIAAAVHTTGGKLVQAAFDPDGDWCGTGHFPHWPPRGLEQLAGVAGKLRGTLKIFPNGIPVLDGYHVVIARDLIR